MDLLISTLVAGVAVGSIYALIAVCYSIVFLGTRVFNLAQGDIVVIALVISYFLLDVAHVPQIVALIAAVAATTVFSIAEERIVIRRFLNRSGSAGFGWFIATLGLALMIEAGTALVTQSQPTVPIASPFGSSPLKIGSVRLAPDLIVCIVLVLVVVAGIEFFYSKTYIGRSMRATAEDRGLAALRGIDPGKVSTIAFALAGAISGLAGFALAPITELNVSVGLSYGLYAFIGLAIGGFGSLRGALLGGWLVGVGQELFDTYLNPNYDILSGLILLLVVLVVRPTGLFGQRGVRTV